MKTNQLLVGLFMALGLSACGSNSTDVNTLFDNPFPPLNSIVANPAANFGSSLLSAGFSANNPYWVFNNLPSSFGGNYIAPANGIVSDYGVLNLNGSTLNYITITHSGRLATRLIGVQVAQVRAGDSVVQGQIVGTYFTSGFTAFQVMVDNTSVCPLSYMSQSFRQYFQAFGQPPCL